MTSKQSTPPESNLSISYKAEIVTAAGYVWYVSMEDEDPTVTASGEEEVFTALDAQVLADVLDKVKELNS